MSEPVSAPPLPPFWHCGRCGSLIPMSYWHRCDESGTHSGPSDSAHAKPVEIVPLEAKRRP